MDVDELIRRHSEKLDRLFDTAASVDVLERQYGAELTSWELALQREFQVDRTGLNWTYQGFVHHTKIPSLILLSPSPWLLQGVLVYFSVFDEVPDNGAFVTIKGKRASIPIKMDTADSVRAVIADDVETHELDFTRLISSPPNIRELSDILFESVGMATASRRIFTHLYVSSPPQFKAIGGLTAGVQAIASRKQIRRLFSFMKQVLPPSFRITKPMYHKIQGVPVRSPQKWRMETGAIREKRLRSICVNRRDTAGFSEVSIATLTEASTGTMPDIPLAISSDDFWIETGNPKEYQLPVTKAAITYQLLTPQVSRRSLDSSFSYIAERIEVLRERFALGRTSLARGNILDADAMGRPLSALKIAQSMARSSWNPKISAKDIKKAWNSILEPAIKEYVEIVDIKEDSERRWGRDARIESFNTKVLRALQKLDPSGTRTLGPTLDDIAQEAGIPTHEVALALQQMKDAGAVYEPRLGHYRLV